MMEIPEQPAPRHQLLLFVDDMHVARRLLCSPHNQASTRTELAGSSHLLRLPALPAICFTSDTGTGTLLRPPLPNFCNVVKITRRMLKFRPSPMASLATRMLAPEWGSLKRRACGKRRGQRVRVCTSG